MSVMSAAWGMRSLGWQKNANYGTPNIRAAIWRSLNTRLMLGNHACFAAQRSNAGLKYDK